jgi:DNA mismatch repair protein MutS2
MVGRRPGGMRSPESTAVHDGVSAQWSAGTPSHIGEAAFPAAASLEFARVLEIVAGLAAGPLGAGRIRARRPSSDPDWVRSELAPVAELLACYSRGDSLDILPVPELALILDRLRVPGSVLEGGELLAIRDALLAARAADGELGRIQGEAPLLASWRVPLPPRGLEKRLAQSLSEEGDVLDSASPALLRARRAVQEARSRLIRRLEAVQRSQAKSSDPAAEVTLRNGRYVIPVRRDARSRVEGIVHDESATGETLFVEPSAAIELGNELRRAALLADREVLQVLRDLTDALRPECETLARAHALCVALDDLNARVRYAHASRAHVPLVRPAGCGIDLRKARHPLLVSRGIETVPFDLTLSAGERTLLISGPNAGGKTVLLKTVGLVAALVQSGIVPPVGPESALPVFERIVADIGDHQSIAADLSTFTAHLVVVRDLLEKAGPGTLILVDEIGSGTDPAEGGALAAATLIALNRRGAFTIATTHLGSLKALAGQVEGVVNGSLQFDPDRLAPTFRFTKGPPGRSYGLAIARQLGIPEEVLADAEPRVSGEERRLDRLLEAAERRERRLADDQAALTEQLAAAEREAARLASERTAIEVREAELRARERGAEQRARSEARRVMMAARAEVEAAVRAARTAAHEEAATGARRQLEEAIRREGDALRRLAEAPQTAAGAVPALAPGQRVRLRSGGFGTVLEVREAAMALVAVGDVKVMVSIEELAPSAEAREGTGGLRQPVAVAASSSPELMSRTRHPSEIDLRGMRVDEAEAATLSALDAAVLDDLPHLRIIHGMGTGALRDVVRRVLTGDRRVARFGFAPANQGGGGVTVAELGA